MLFLLLVKCLFCYLYQELQTVFEKLFPEIMIKYQDVRVKEGILRGREVKSRITNEIFYSFRGIPYAKPPIGRLRFQDPEPFEKWHGIREAFHEGNIAPQKNLLFPLCCIGDEDCLFLNVHTPKLPSLSKNPLLPVILYLHGGAYKFGSGNSGIYGPEYLVQHNVIVVTCNYRLEILGFLSLGNEKAPGNYGLKDQVVVMRWIQNNIKAFGGDPNNVTLFGGSVGAVACHLHILSPMSKGLFHRAIMHSGCALSPWGIYNLGRERAFLLGELLGCKTDNDQVLIDFLRTVHPYKFSKIAIHVLTELEKNTNMVPFTPVIEPPGPNAFLSEDPRLLLEEGRFNHVPCIFGVNSNEGMMIIRDAKKLMCQMWAHSECAGAEKDYYISKKLNKNFGNKLEEDPAFFTLYPYQRLLDKTKKREEFGNKIREFYFNGDSIHGNMRKMFDVYSDFYFLNEITQSLQYHLRAQDSDIYFLYFSFEGSLGIMKKILNVHNIKGVCHADEIGYTFPLKLFRLYYSKNSPEEKIVYQLTKRITNFAKMGDPNCEDMERLGAKWIPATKDCLNYLDLNLNPEMKMNLFSDRMSFWSEFNRNLIKELQLRVLSYYDASEILSKEKSLFR